MQPEFLLTPRSPLYNKSRLGEKCQDVMLVGCRVDGMLGSNIQRYGAQNCSLISGW